MAACTPSIHVYLVRPLFLLSSGIHSIINFGILSSVILLTWPYYYSLFFSMISMMSGLTLNLLTTTIIAPPSNASEWQMGFNSAFKGCFKIQQIHQLCIQFINYVW